MAPVAFVAGDWGTSHLRLYLCDLQGNILDAKKGPGIAAVKTDVASAFFSQIEDWGRYGPLPAVLCGMVGSTIGWREAGYLPCPARPEALASNAKRFEANGRTILVAPGLSCRNRLQAPDMMRGEETQILGAMQLEPRLAEGRHVLCLPGTHTKWVSLKDGTVEHFLTAVTGELYDILARHSVLVNAKDAANESGGTAFGRALEKTRRHPDVELIHLLFEVRSLQLKGEIAPQDAADYLSGLIVGQDASGAKRILQNEFSESESVTVIAAPRLGDLYAEALREHHAELRRLDGDAASLAGLTALHDSLEGIHDAA